MSKLRYRWPTWSQHLRDSAIGSTADSWADASDVLSFAGFQTASSTNTTEPMLEWLTKAVCDSFGCGRQDASDSWTEDWSERT
jgi:hypothetical protein